jgi:hypothetical protein
LRNATRYLRIIGIIVIVIGAILWWFGGKEISVSYKEIVIPIPLEQALVLVGLLLVFVPVLFIYILALFMPGRTKKRLLDYAASLDPDSELLRQDPKPDTVAYVLNAHFRRANKRFYITLFLLLVSVFGVLPLLVAKGLSTSNYRRESRRIVQLVQETRVEFSSGDHFREHLRDAEPSMGQKETATYRTYRILRRLYDPSILTPTAFSEAMTAIYEEEIKPHTTPASGLLNTDTFKTPELESEPALAGPTYLTLLAIICNEQGDQGRHVDPYLQARQLLRLASNNMHAPTNAPSTHNASGVNYAGLLKAYDGYAGKFRSNPVIAEKVRSELGLPEPLSRLALLREAKNEYTAAARQSSSNLAKARSLNNQVDVLLTFLHLVHIENRLDSNEIRDETDRSFLENELCPQIPNQIWQPKRLIAILNNWRRDLSQALTLSREPEIFFTRAQLYSIGGSLGEKYHLVDSFWGDHDVVARASLTDLGVAAAMHLPKWVFDRSASNQLYLEWLWGQSALTPKLEELASISGVDERE